jgi:hypothetical protein
MSTTVPSATPGWATDHDPARGRNDGSYSHTITTPAGIDITIRQIIAADGTPQPTHIELDIYQMDVIGARQIAIALSKAVEMVEQEPTKQVS